MSQSLSNILTHIVFSTKNREAIIEDNIRENLHAYIGGIINRLKGVPLSIGSVADHIHLLIVLPRTCSPSNLIKEIKTSSTKWIKNQSSVYQNFHWQGGYGIFSISPNHKKALEQYIINQAEHHKKVTFQDEFLRLLKKNDIQWDDRYIWD
ncbi:MAG: transposase [Planctomycetota bacterium]|nr:MAG: transposase [Planctomycetota bacterium]